MIFVTLGTQDKDFSRLLKAIDKAIDEGYINEKVIVQAGCTKYASKNMEIFDLLSAPDFEKYIEKANLVITHGGAGSILDAVKRNKKIIAAARLAKYHEHHNDHQKQIIGEFAKQGYLLELRDFNKLGNLIEKSKTFKQKKFVSNTDNMIKLIREYIEDTDNISWYNKYREKPIYLCFAIVNIISFIFLRLKFHLSFSNFIAWLIGILITIIANKLFSFKNGEDYNKTSLMKNITLFTILSFVFDIGFMFLFIKLGLNEVLSKISSNVFIIIMNYIFCKMFILKK